MHILWEKKGVKAIMSEMYNPDGESHVHDLSAFSGYETPDNVHIHEYNIPTTVNDEHRHQVQGRTAPAVGGLDCHLHYYEGTTTLDDGHVHYFRGYTGPAVAGVGGSHRHRMEGQTTFNDQHLHYYSGLTGEAVHCRQHNEEEDD
jgi:hypothetical protein